MASRAAPFIFYRPGQSQKDKELNDAQARAHAASIAARRRGRGSVAGRKRNGDVLLFRFKSSESIPNRSLRDSSKSSKSARDDEVNQHSSPAELAVVKMPPIRQLKPYQFEPTLSAA